MGSPQTFSKRGKLSFANAGPNSNYSQFIITLVPAMHLQGKHTIFGEVVEGFDVVEAISRVPVNPQDRPKSPIVIQTVTIERV